MTKLPATVLLALACAACSKPVPSPEAPVTVEVARPLVQQISDWDDYSGRFEPVDAVEVRPRVSGAIQSVHFTDGELVTEGQLLFVIDPRPYAAELARAKAAVAGAKAELANADAELKRAESLVTDKLLSQAQLELQAAGQLKAAADLDAAEAALQVEELNLSFTRVTAPLAGRASYRRLAPGNLVGANTTVLTTIVSEDPIRFLFDALRSRSR
jgi:RND family efflux transporter MFP subunit